MESEQPPIDWSDDVPQQPGIVEFRHPQRPGVIFCYELTRDGDLVWLATIPQSTPYEPPDFEGQWRVVPGIGE